LSSWSLATPAGLYLEQLALSYCPQDVS
jgi:hypothetical protein